VRAPELYAKLVTMAVPHSSAIAAHFVTNPEQLQRSWYIFLFQTPLAEIAVPYDDYALIDLLWRDWSPGHVPDAAFMRTLKDTLASPGSTEAAIGYYRSMLGNAPTDPQYDGVQAAGAGPIGVPSLYLHGADDGCMGVEMVVESELTPFFPQGLQVEVVPSSGHFLHLDQPEAVNQRVLDFVRS
jgi:pimeloyl-ACP methyl ester carboxylesterase